MGVWTGLLWLFFWGDQDVLSRVIKIVAPKKAKLSEAETELANQMDKLNEKRAQLQQVIFLFV